MAKVCEICGKRPRTGRNVSHANNRSLRKFNPNLQSIRVNKDGKPVRMNVCTRCIKAGKIVKWVS